MGIGLVDYLVEDQLDPATGQTYYNFGVINDDDKEYKKFHTPDTIKNALYVMKANQQINSDLYTYLRINMQQGQINFLIDEAQAKNQLLATERGKRMSPATRAEHLLPFVQTTMLKNQLCNLVLTKETGTLVSLQQASRGIPKDKVSALIYGLSYVRDYEQNNKCRKRRDISEYMFFS